MKKILILLSAAVMLVACGEQSAKTNSSENQSDAVTEVMMSRRSIRQYKETAIGRDTLDAIMECGVNAPNGRGMQAYEVRVVDSPALIDSMTAAVLVDNPELGKRPGFKNIFVNAPCVVFVAFDRSYDLSQVDCGLLGENIMLSAWSKGIGSCCLGSSVRWMKDSPTAAPYLERLGFSEGYELLYCIALGYPDEAPAAKPRNGEKVKYVENY
ncbi:MAG: nitroreductase family protein [Bacteroidales bacterium]|nr:nitroreductase family protein [Bacteroidales bacterium]